MSGNKIYSTKDKGEGQAPMLRGGGSQPLPFSAVYQIWRAGESPALQDDLGP